MLIMFMTILSLISIFTRVPAKPQLSSPGATLDNIFIVPGPPGPFNNFIGNLNWTIGSTQELEWTTVLESYYEIEIWQQWPEPNAGGATALGTVCCKYAAFRAVFKTLTCEPASQPGQNNSGQQSCQWIVQTYHGNISYSPVFFFWLAPGNAANITSHFFNISASEPSSTVSVPTAVTYLSSSSTAASASTTAPTSTPESSHPDDTASSQASVKIGLGIGLGIGIPVVLVAGIYVGFKVFRRQQSPVRNGKALIQLDGLSRNRRPLSRASGQAVQEAKFLTSEEYRNAAEVDGPAELEDDRQRSELP